MHQDPSGMLARIPFGLTTGPIEGAEILVAGCRKETVASEMRSNVLKYRDTLIRCPVVHFSNIWLIFTENDGLLVVDMGQNGQDMDQNSFFGLSCGTLCAGISTREM